MWHDHMWNGPWMMGWGIIPMVFFWLLVIGVLIYLIKSLLSDRSEEAADSSVQILKERLASGDIDQAEFDSLIEKLKHTQ
ncbi:MAG: SHOCT domain-containing protein [Motiliproteus sp.]|nr:SHOCT domain-containing protein [Motiliproteus sp.]MCW9053166.1 SHOCT domain-containing protein [Motiliproteus sp.]